MGEVVWQHGMDNEGDYSMDIDFCVLSGWTECPEEDVLVLQSGAGKYHRPDVCEVYSPPRVTATAREMGMKGGWALDLTTDDDQGRPWDFNDEDCR